MEVPPLLTRLGQASRGAGFNAFWKAVTPHEGSSGTTILHQTVSKGFLLKSTLTKTAKYWVAQYEQENEDEPFSIQKTEVNYLPGQDKEQLMLQYCHSLFKKNPKTWEILVHQGPEDIPQSGDQIVARLSREKFSGAEELII